ncbi:hypothetical protein L3V82_07300 [Thiotrichales bacterium 19S3-7]|nr:hypothetical protein [Thiotrichales bacterium 19S3-7]MCF6801963.1 hypothetical protein [Thiotrichales bacterium 19S3-11]
MPNNNIAITGKKETRDRLINAFKENNTDYSIRGPSNTCDEDWYLASDDTDSFSVVSLENSSKNLVIFKTSNCADRFIYTVDEEDLLYEQSQVKTGLQAVRREYPRANVEMVILDSDLPFFDDDEKQEVNQQINTLNNHSNYAWGNVNNCQRIDLNNKEQVNHVVAGHYEQYKIEKNKMAILEVNKSSAANAKPFDSLPTEVNCKIIEEATGLTIQEIDQKCKSAPLTFYQETSEENQSNTLSI